MSRYIDADLLWNKISRAYQFSDRRGIMGYVKQCLNKAPTVDVELERHRGQWISTKEKMPENDTSVLICACGHRVTAYYNHLKKAFILTEDEKLYYEAAAVSHWMPLPEPPKGE